MLQLAWLAGSSALSCPGLTWASIVFAKGFLTKMMDCRGKPGNDD
jgi:hypothetical protein